MILYELFKGRDAKNLPENLNLSDLKKKKINEAFNK